MANYETSQPAKRTGWLWVIILALLAFAGGLIGSNWFEAQVRSRLPWAQQLPGGLTVSNPELTRITTLEEQVQTLTARVAALEQRPGDPALAARVAALEAGRVATPTLQGPAPDVIGPAPSVVEPELTGRVSALETKVGALELSKDAAQGQLQALDQRMIGLTQAATQQSGAAAEAVQAAKRAVAVLGVRRALEQGQPLTLPLAALVPTLPEGSTDVAVLRRVERGAPTLAGLRSQFTRLRTSLEPQAAPESQSFMDTVKGLMTVKRTEETAPAQNPLAQAQARLNAGDVAGAAALLRRLPPERQRVAQAWLGQADLYVATQAAIARLEAAALK
jgi:hypothetical protein